MISSIARINSRLASLGARFESPVLLVIRLYWGWQFFQTGRAKLMNVPAFVQRFAGWGVPLPHVNVIVAGRVETCCGLLLLVGLGSRIVAIPLMATMVVAYLTAGRDTLRTLFSNPDDFVSAAPFLFLFAAVIVFVFGPGRYSIDALIFRKSASRR